MGGGNRNFSYRDPVILIGGGDVNSQMVADYASCGWRVVCADGGANQLQGGSLVPDLIIGDLDSLSDAEYWRTQTTVLELSEQDTTAVSYTHLTLPTKA